MSPVVVSTVSSMYELAEDYLVAIVGAMGTTAAGAPDRAFVAPGSPMFETDCAQACVQVLTLAQGNTLTGPGGEGSAQRHQRGFVNLVGMVGYALRCAEVSEGNQNVYQPLFDDTLSAQALAVYEDGWAVWNHVNALIQQNLLFGGPCGLVHFDGGVPMEPGGGMVGWQFTIRVELGGYTPAVDSS